MLPGLFMNCMLAIPTTILVHLDAFAIILAILGCYVVTPLALLAGKCNFDSLFVLSHFLFTTPLEISPNTLGL